MKKAIGTAGRNGCGGAEGSLPPQIQEALGELVGAAREGLLALSVGVGLGVVHELMELEVSEVVGPKGKHNCDRSAKRHGHEDGSMTLGGGASLFVARGSARLMTSGSCRLRAMSISLIVTRSRGR